jgi:hypothetical protein
MKQYKLTNLIAGWATFLIAAITYILTIEPTVSFWDCGEFITSSFKLEVGHPPGAPFFMILANFFTALSMGDMSKVPVMVNIMSALASAFTIAFLFWSITHIAKKIVAKNAEEISLEQTIAIVGSGLVGALAYTFSDTFWFSAVEGEVYAMSSLFTALVFWAILKWENVADEKYANRWLVLIAYLMGVSIGVHLLNLLAIPAIVFVYYFKKYEATRLRSFLAIIIGIVLLGGVMYIIIPGFIKLASIFEMTFVNSFGLPFNSGAIAFVIFALAAISFGLYYTQKNHKAIANTIILGITVMMIGYSSYVLILIRSTADTPMNQNNPNNLFSLKSYLNREQYGESPLVYGQYFNAEVKDYDKTSDYYEKINGRYEVIDQKTDRIFDPAFCTIFPRMYSNQPDHIQGYKKWAGITDDKRRPSFGENLAYFFKYQVGYMYIRYFMWNFAGRQNDIQGNGEVMFGNWISGIPLIDNSRLGDQDKLPDYIKNNKGRNAYFFLPLILGILGIWFLYARNKKDFWVVLLLFFFTGLAIVLYLNQPPFQPRERDYAYAGSFYAFAIFIGLGVLAVYEFFKKHVDGKMGAIVATVICLALVPSVLVAENWDDHDRSSRYTARDFAKNYLESCAKDAVIFTNGDNDTFPLWYAQEVEGIRTDVRVINLSYLNTDWYIDQMKQRAYLSAPVPFSLLHEQYRQGHRDIVYVTDKIKDYTDLKQLIKFVGSDDPQTKINQGDHIIEYFPTNKFSLPGDSARCVNNGTIPKSYKGNVVKFLNWSPRDQYIYKNELMVLDLISNANWDRPIYFSLTMGPESFMNLEDYFQLEGMAYRLVPIKTVNPDGQTGRVATEIMYDNLMNKFAWGNITDPKVYLDENNLRMLMNVKNNFSRLAIALAEEGQNEKALKVLDKCIALMPNHRVPYNYFNGFIAEAYYKINQVAKGDQVVNTMLGNISQEINYYNSLDAEQCATLQEEQHRALASLNNLLRVTTNAKQNEMAKKIEKIFAEFYTSYQTRFPGSLGQ